MRLQFTKMQGTGNDFVVLDNQAGNIDFSPELVRYVCNRHFGIGADGILSVEKSDCADLRMRIFNSDGSEPEMCGNGIRCFARYARERWLVDAEEFEIETLAGVIRPRLSGNRVAVDMGLPRLEAEDIPVNLTGRVLDREVRLAGRDLLISCVSMGNPHCIIFGGKTGNDDIRELGPLIEMDPLFPNKTNVEFTQILGPGEIRIDVWERGAGVTLACGTGACAAVVAAHLTGRTGREVLVHLPGGDLSVEWKNDDRVQLIGPADFVFQGEINLDLPNLENTPGPGQGG